LVVLRVAVGFHHVANIVDAYSNRYELEPDRMGCLHSSGNHTATFKTTKSGKARVVAVQAFVLDALTRFFARQAESRNGLRQNFNSNQTIVADPVGRPQNPLSFTAAFRRALKRAGLRDSGTHIMRHTYATLALQSGADVLTVSRALGHHDAGFTLREYGHVLAGAKVKVAAGVDAAVNRARVAASATTRTLRLVQKSIWRAKCQQKCQQAEKQESNIKEQILTA
jgi:Phage integrase family